MTFSTSFLAIISFGPISSGGESGNSKILALVTMTYVKVIWNYCFKDASILWWTLTVYKIVIFVPNNQIILSSTFNIVFGAMLYQLDVQNQSCCMLNLVNVLWHNHTVSMDPFGMQLVDKPSYIWRRVLLKVSGEALADHSQNIDRKITMAIAREVASVMHFGIEASCNCVGGGGVIFFMDLLGHWVNVLFYLMFLIMFATVMNAVFLLATMESIGIPTCVQIAFCMSEVAEPYILRRAVMHLEKGRVVIFAVGTGNPFFTTVTAAAFGCAESSIFLSSQN
ncbi:hypothetical protein V6Z12_D12G001100 [Gossypium hirsutum]